MMPWAAIQLCARRIAQGTLSRRAPPTSSAAGGAHHRGSSPRATEQAVPTRQSPGRDLDGRVSVAWPLDSPRQRKEATMSANADPAAPPRLELYGGRWTALIPALVLIAVMCILSFAERAAVPAFWVGGFAALV